MGGLDFASMHAMRSVGQCDVNFPSVSSCGSCSKAVANDYRPHWSVAVIVCQWPLLANYCSLILNDTTGIVNGRIKQSIQFNVHHFLKSSKI